MNEHTTIIAEVGSNYNGDIDLAGEYIRKACKGGADAVKFQTLRKNRLVAPWLFSDGIKKENPIYKQFASLELPDDWHRLLKAEADACGVEFISTPFYLEAVDLMEQIGVRTYKIASGDITFFPLLEAVGSTHKKVILSTGASTLEDVDKALNKLIKSGSSDVALLHCVSNYPPQWDEMNLKALITLKAAFGLPVGISDHSPGSLVPIAAIALGATIVEKHVTFDRSLLGPDHPFAMTMDEFGEMVRQIRCLEEALGTGTKTPAESEQAKQHRMRRGIYDPVTFEPTKKSDGVWLRPEHPWTRSSRSYSGEQKR